MRYLFIIQGEGRGHLTQSLALAAMLRRHGHEVCGALVGSCKNREIPQFFCDKIGTEVTSYDSPTLDYGKNGKRGSVIQTLLVNTTPSKLKRWRKSIDTIVERIGALKPDVIINFYDQLIGFASMFHRIDQPIFSIGHQFLVDHPDFTHRSKHEAGSLMLRLNNFVSSYGSTKRLALSFYPMVASHARRIEVVPPLLRSEIFELESVRENYILGYMLNPAYLNEVMAWKRRNPEVTVHLFWDKLGAAELEERMPGLWLHKINDSEFLRLMSRCKGYVTTAGFESICEAMYLGKPVLMIPAHVEQQINAADASGVGAGGVANEFNLTLLDNAIDNYTADTEAFRKWVDSAEERFLEAITKI